jgi:DNA modification methylase
LGIEIHQKYVDLANERLARADGKEDARRD